MPTPPLLLLLAAGLLGGAVAGVGLERAGVLSPVAETDEVGAEVAPAGDRVAVLDCPEGVVVAGLTGGDRVLATGQREDGTWIEIRSPLDLEAPAWVSAAALTADRDLADLPEAECERPIGTTTTSSTSTSSSTSSTTSTSSTSTTSSTLPATTTTTAPDRPPRVDVSSSVGQIVTRSPQDLTVCFVPAGLPMVATITARVDDDSPNVRVSMSFVTVAGGQQLSAGDLAVGAPTGGVFSASLGPLPNSAAAAAAETTATVTATVTDGVNAPASATVTVDVEKCTQ